MAEVFLPDRIVNAMAEAGYPSSTFGPTASATNGTTTLTFTSTEASHIMAGFTVTGAGITSGGVVTGVVASTGVVTITGTITTLTATKYVFTAPCYTGLNSSSPSNTVANEVSGGTYGRQATTFGLQVEGAKTETNPQIFTNGPAV